MKFSTLHSADIRRLVFDIFYCKYVRIFDTKLTYVHNLFVRSASLVSNLLLLQI